MQKLSKSSTITCCVTVVIIAARVILSFGKTLRIGYVRMEFTFFKQCLLLLLS